MLFAFYISGHGLGHSSRAVELIDEILRRRSDARVAVRTSARSSAFDRIRSDRVTIDSCDVDTGVVQIDSLRPDVEETARRAAGFYRDFDRRVRSETEELQRLGASVVVADVPPLAVAAADRAGLPSVVVANFTWDWIYAFYPEFAQLAPGVVETIAHAYSKTTLTLRLPIAGGFASMTGVRDIPLIARQSRRDRHETRRRLGLDESQLSVLVSFGGYDVDLPCRAVEESGMRVLAPERAPDGLRYEDLVAAVDVVVSKPGYGIVSECIANETPLLYTSRGRFAEYDVMVEEMPQLLRCRFISQEDLLAGRWRPSIEALLAQNGQPSRPPVNGASVAAGLILELVAP